MMKFDPHALCADNFAKPEGSVGRQLAQIMYEKNLPMILQSAEALNLPPNARLLEIGHGGAQHLSQLIRRYPSLDYTGVEHANTMHNLCLQNAYLRSLNCRFIKVATDSYLLPFADAEFDSLLAVNVIYFYGRIKAALEEYHRVLRFHGRLAIAFQDIHTLISSPIDFTGMILYEPYTIRRLLVDAGFGNIKVDSYYEQQPRPFGGVAESCYHIVTAVNNQTATDKNRH